MGLKQWLCVECWHEILSDEHRKPQSIHWTDGHICTFKSPEDIDMSFVTPFDDLWAGLSKNCIFTESEEFPEDALREAYDAEITMMAKYAIKAKLPKVILHPFRKSGSQHITEFEVKDVAIRRESNKINFHGQDTSQWVYAGCILYDERDNRVSRHH